MYENSFFVKNTHIPINMTDRKMLDKLHQLHIHENTAAFGALFYFLLFHAFQLTFPGLNNTDFHTFYNPRLLMIPTGWAQTASTV